MPVEKNTRKKILVVEDDEDVRGLLSAIFETAGCHEILFAMDGEEALNITQQERPSVILLDIALPKINGYEVCKSIKSSPGIYNTKILMLSGLAQTSDLSKAQEAGADGYITKPFNPTTLIEKVKALLGEN